MALSKQVGLDIRAWVAGRPLLPDRLGQWTSRSTASNELGQWLRAILQMDGFADLEAVTNHSLKATLLSFMAKWGGDEPSRLIWGHHMSQKTSLPVYARDMQAAPLRRLEECLEAIRQGAFLPDLTRSGMMIPRTISNKKGRVFGQLTLCIHEMCVTW